MGVSTDAILAFGFTLGEELPEAFQDDDGGKGEAAERWCVMKEPLLDDDGENRAVRAFLMMYGVPGLTVAAMRVHMTRCGFPHWPGWVIEGATSHLTKAGAQLWLRHLFALEDAPRHDVERLGQSATTSIAPHAAPARAGD